ncbi:hypothetical protein [Mycobacterium parmense]|uniref:Uncharacterized protein n=1 Tax=Mycobacterium parmense TaxID=185642 RepID=A0A7I7YSJ3_9MYCO|nr:hypothetical protein [Mycobacterium parmense]MCV7351707.1 hypothetical protein [Mycobacterium parmense]ORW60191.1 hypothetical protein AWC20_09015 [Mycobacterium parmense]BBZ44828.1 hypothetical protein MPRM_21090 [Mycobacterium parmense]
MKPEWKDWKDFFTAVAPISGTILALLFVAFQVNALRWGKVPLRQAGAARSLVETSAPLIIGLCALYPGGRWTLGGKVAGCMGLGSVLVFLIFYLRSVMGKTITPYDHWLACGAVTTAGFSSAMLYSSLPNIDDSDLRRIGWICIWELVLGVVGAWVVLAVKAPDDEAAKAALGEGE